MHEDDHIETSTWHHYINFVSVLSRIYLGKIKDMNMMKASSVEVSYICGFC